MAVIERREAAQNVKRTAKGPMQREKLQDSSTGRERSRAIATGSRRPKPRSAAAREIIRAFEGVRNLLKRSQTLMIKRLDRTMRGLAKRMLIDRNDERNIFIFLTEDFIIELKFL
jgi:hypothetical protein